MVHTCSTSLPAKKGDKYGPRSLVERGGRGRPGVEGRCGQRATPSEVFRPADRTDAAVGRVARPLPELGVRPEALRRPVPPAGVAEHQPLHASGQGRGCQRVLQRVHDDLSTRGTACPFDLLSYIDGKAVVVSPVSKDPDAKRGKAGGAFAKGYKLHAFINEWRRVVVWSVTPLNTDEKIVAAELLNHLPPPPPPTAAGLAVQVLLTLSDSNYDSAPLHREFADHGRQLLAPLRCEQLVGPDGRSRTTLAGMGPARREVVAVWDEHPDLAGYVMKSRNNAEGTFSVLSLACGLDRLPGFVRRLPRVTRWIGCKLILYHARLLAQEAIDGKAA